MLIHEQIIILKKKLREQLETNIYQERDPLQIDCKGCNNLMKSFRTRLEVGINCTDARIKG